MSSPNLFRTLRIDNWGTFIVNKLNSLYQREKECDLTLVFSNKQEVKVHKVLMYASSGFMVRCINSNPQKNVILLSNDFQHEASLAIIEFIYSGRLDVKEGMVEQIYAAARLFDIPVLAKLMDSQRLLLQDDKIIETRKSETRPQSHPPLLHKEAVTPRPTPTRIEEPRPTRFFGPALTLTPTDSVSGDMTYNAHALENQLASPLLPSLRVTAAALRRKRNETVFEELKAAAPSGQTTKHASETGPVPKRLCKEELRGIKEFDDERRLRKEQLLGDEDPIFTTDDADDYAPDLGEEDEDHEKEEPVKAEKTPEPPPAISSKEMEVTVIQGSTPNSSIVTLYDTEKNVLMTKEIPEGPLEINVPNKLIGEILKSVPQLVLDQSSVQLKIVKKYLDATRRTMKTRISRIALRASTTDKPPGKQQATPQPAPPPALHEDDEGKAVVNGDTKVSPFEIRNGPWICQTCTDQADDVDCRMTAYYDWREHLIDVHGFKSDPHLCEFCGFRALKRNFMLYHQYVVHHIPTPASAYFDHCIQCDYISVNPAAMRRHRATHPDEKQSTCKACSAVFDSPEELYEHTQAEKHTRYAIGYLCPVCHSAFDAEAELYDHIEADHKNFAATLQSRGGFPIGLGYPFPTLFEIAREDDGEAPRLEQEGQHSENGIFPDNPPEFDSSEMEQGAENAEDLEAPVLEPEGQVEPNEDTGSVLVANSTIINPDGSMAVMLEGSDSYTIIPADSYRYAEDGSLQILQD